MHREARGAAAALAAALAVAACGGSGGGGPAPAPAAPPVQFLAAADVQRIVAQAAGEAQARGLRAHIAVVDRVGNVLATFRMDGAPETVAISSGLGVTGGLDGIPAGVVPAALAAISKALTGAYLSSQGNAFTTRTAGQIVQERFNPQEAQQPSGPLYGVQFSQLACSDVNRGPEHGPIGPKRTPLGLAADPGGIPLYKGGEVVGGIGIEADGLYGLDRDITDLDEAPEERIAIAGATGFAAPADIRGDRITADGRTFRYVDGEGLAADPARAPAFLALPGRLVAVPGYSTGGIGLPEVIGNPGSGIRPAGEAYIGQPVHVLVDHPFDNNRFPFRAGTDGGLTAAEVRELLAQAAAVARRVRAQIRRPPGSHAQVNITVVDTAGEILGFVRTPDAPIFGIDVSVQKARTAMFFSLPNAFDLAQGFPVARHLVGGFEGPPGQYLAAARAFLGSPAEFTGVTAWSTRAVGNLHRPFFPDGVQPSPPGPFSTPISRWSPFNVGLQLDLVYGALVASLGGELAGRCGEVLRNGMQIFPGGTPIYRGTRLLGAIGVSGDGVDQDDMIAYLGVANAARALGTGMGHAPAAMRADRLAPLGTRLRYVQCPQAPFLDSTVQHACEP